MVPPSGGWAGRQALLQQRVASSLGSQPGTMPGWRGCCCWRQPQCSLRLLLLVPFVLVPPIAAATEGQNRCDTIYQGFAECLIRLGDSMGRGGELETICRSWNDFHACASGVLSGCPEEAAAVWESLQQEARRAPHPDNLHTLCGAPVRVRERDASPEINQETLRATGPTPALVPAPSLLAAALTLACLLGPLA
ncbi:neuritin-like protein [Fukomys damarensis]|uniref:neuritin-like protein n=1 Tax=Fukomys damarensis TaxID=885580 RepID=UPI00053F7A5B|nr:neuritin-like protein [Fukomys damarensis]